MTVDRLHGLLLIDKPDGISSFHVVEQLQHQLSKRFGKKKKELPKIGHGGTLDPFATGLLVLCIGDGVKLSRYLLDSKKTYEAEIRFGATTASGDLTDPVSEKTDRLPASREELERAAQEFTKAPYLQTPPMYSAKKVDGKPLYELARQGIEIERKPKACTVYSVQVRSYSDGVAKIACDVSSGTYIRTFAQDLAKKLGSLAYLTALRRTASGPFLLEKAAKMSDFESVADWTTLPAFVEFDRVLDHFPRIAVTEKEKLSLHQGKQEILTSILMRAPSDPAQLTRIVLHLGAELVAVAVRDDSEWGLERVFTRSPSSAFSPSA